MSRSRFVLFRCVVLLRQVVINELEPDGWLTWLQNVKLDEQQARDTHTHTHPTEAAAAVLCDLLHDVKQRIIPVLPRQAFRTGCDI